MEYTPTCLIPLGWHHLDQHEGMTHNTKHRPHKKKLPIEEEERTAAKAKENTRV